MPDHDSVPTPATVPVAPPPPVPIDPFFTGGDWITLGVGLLAGILAFLTWLASRQAAQAADRAAKANEDMVLQQQEANRLAAHEIAMLQRQHDADRAEADAREMDQARLIRCAVTNFGGLQVRIEDMSLLPITSVRLLNVVGTPAEWTWQPNPRTINNHVTAGLIRAGQDPPVLRRVPGRRRRDT